MARSGQKARKRALENLRNVQPRHYTGSGLGPASYRLGSSSHAGRTALNNLRNVQPGMYTGGGPIAPKASWNPSGRVPLPPPPKNPAEFARKGKRAAAWVRRQPASRRAIGAAAIIGGAALYNRTGRATDRLSGRPTGIYGY